MFTAELISVGTELLLGEILDSNAAWIAQNLKERGVNLYWKTTVGDNLGRIQDIITRALGRADIVILGGGLGPTDDDLTREAILATLSEPATTDQKYLTQLRAWFESRGRSFPESNTKQAWVSKSTEPLPNPVGTAPGWFVRVPETLFGPNKFIVAMPGPPREMKPMFLNEVLPRLALPESGLHYRTFRTIGIGESHLAENLKNLTQNQNPSIGTYARRDGVHVRVAARAETLEQAKQLAQPTEIAVQEKLQDFIFGTDEQTLPEIVLALLQKNNHTLGVLESITGGLLSDELSSTNNHKIFLGGAIANNSNTLGHMGANQQAQESGFASETTALEMARLARSLTGASIGLAASGSQDSQAGMPAVLGKTAPVLAQQQHLTGWAASGMPAGTMFIAIDGLGDTPILQTTLVVGDPRTLKERATFNALGALWRELKKIP